jgi:multidrug resistance efflux pump
VRFFVILGLLTLVASAAGAIWAVNSHGQGGGAQQAAAKPGAPAAGSKSLVCYGFVDIDGGVTPLYPLQQGRVEKVYVKENQVLSDKDDLKLLKLDDTLAKQRLEEAAADLKAAEDQLTVAKDAPRQHELKVEQQKEAIAAMEADLNGAKSAQERAESLVKIKQLTEQEFNVIKQRVLKAEAGLRAEQKKLKELEELDRPQLQINRAEQDVAAKKARVAQAQYAVDECVLRAPGPGTVLQVLVNPGMVLGAQPTQPAIVFMPKKDSLIIRAEVEQEFAGRVAENQDVSVQEENSTKQTWHGKITQIARWYAQRRASQSETLRISNDVHTLECIITLKDVKPDQSELRVGQRVRVMIGKD